MIIYLKLQNRLQNASWMGMVCPTAYLLLHAKDPFLIFCHDAPVSKSVARHWANIKTVNLLTMDKRHANVLVQCYADEQNFIGPMLFSDIEPT